jgi:hypothetical protein
MNDLPTKYDNEKHALKVGDTPHSVRHVDASSSAVQSELDAAAAVCQLATALSHLLPPRRIPAATGDEDNLGQMRQPGFRQRGAPDDHLALS